MRRRWPVGLTLAAVVTLLAAGVARAADPTREEALAALAGRDVEQRRYGALALADTGLMADLPRLAAALRDPDARVRAFAEGAMWQVWSRSGDDAVDGLFALGVEQIVGELEGLAEGSGIVAKRGPLGGACAPENGSGLAGKAEEGASLVALDQHDLGK